MKQLGAVVVVGLLILFGCATTVRAVSSGMLITQVQAGATSGDGAATQEFISLYNNSDQDIDVTDWCLTNKSATIVCLSAPAANVTLHATAHTYITIASTSFKSAHPDTSIDFTYSPLSSSSGSITASSDTISLLNPNGQVVDSTAWTTTLSGGSLLQRKLVAGSTITYVDTDALADFAKLTTLTVPASGLYETEVEIDVCPNINGAQAAVPAGNMIDASGNCVVIPPVDVCPNVDGLQLDIPENYLKNSSGDCLLDACLNLSGLQLSIPAGYEMLSAGACTLVPLEDSPIIITELLPNPSGTDAGNEYVELYNPTDHDVNLKGYSLCVGSNFDKCYVLPDKVMTSAAYLVVKSDIAPFTLVNTSSRARLLTATGTITSETTQYADPDDDVAWALIDGTWQFTNQPTPGSANALWLEVSDSGVVLGASALAPCGAGKYRNPLTNRCRNIVTDATVLATCDADEYRSPETNRCRKLSTANTSPAPCKAGQERNPDTNRCRNVAATRVPAAAFPVEKVADTSKEFAGWWAFGGVTTIALSYAGWEWRKEMLGLIRKVMRFLPFVK